jgi:hypothetical protein
MSNVGLMGHIGVGIQILTLGFPMRSLAEYVHFGHGHPCYYTAQLYTCLILMSDMSWSRATKETEQTIGTIAWANCERGGRLKRRGQANFAALSILFWYRKPSDLKS